MEKYERMDTNVNVSIHLYLVEHFYSNTFHINTVPFTIESIYFNVLTNRMTIEIVLFFPFRNLKKKCLKKYGMHHLKACWLFKPVSMLTINKNIQEWIERIFLLFYCICVFFFVTQCSHLCLNFVIKKGKILLLLLRSTVKVLEICKNDGS